MGRRWAEKEINLRRRMGFASWVNAQFRFTLFPGFEQVMLLNSKASHPPSCIDAISNVFLFCVAFPLLQCSTPTEKFRWEKYSAEFRITYVPCSNLSSLRSSFHVYITNDFFFQKK